MAVNNLIENSITPENHLGEEIDMVTVKRKNKSDTERQRYKITSNIPETIKWCRDTFGERGDGWDFSGGTEKCCTVEIWSSRLILLWKWREWGN